LFVAVIAVGAAERRERAMHSAEPQAKPPGDKARAHNGTSASPQTSPNR
jgi:hypothetical protein